MTDWPATYCRTCGARPGEPCTTSSGNIAAGPHKQRPAEGDARLSPARPAAAIPVRVRRAVNVRAVGRCEYVNNEGIRCPARSQHLHHRRLRSLGGEDTPENLMAVCHGHHRIIHEHVAASIRRGDLIDAGGAP